MSNYWQDKRVMVTGGHGFIGSHTARILAERNPEDVYVVRRKDYDLTNENDVVRLFKEHPSDVVVHLAGIIGGVGALKSQPADYCSPNLLMNIFMLHHAWKSGAQKLLAIGAGCGYPKDAETPMKEDGLWNGYPHPDTAPYALAKRMLTVQSDSYWAQHNFCSITAIPGNVYGPDDNFDLKTSNVVPALVRKFIEATANDAPSVEVWGTGKAARDFVYVDDLADGMLCACEACDKANTFNISSGEETPIRTVVELLTKITGFKGEVVWNTDKPDGQLRRRLDIARAQSDLQWSPKMDIEKGLKLTVDWYRDNMVPANG